MSDKRLFADAISKIGLSDPQVIQKAKEMLRIMKNTIPPGHLETAENFRHLYAIELACKALSLSFDKTKLHEQVTIEHQLYHVGLLWCNHLTRFNQLSAPERKMRVIWRLAVWNKVNLPSAALDILSHYKKIYIDKLPKSQQSHLKINSAVCQAAAFFVAIGGTENKVSSYCEQYYQHQHIHLAVFLDIH